MVRISKGIEMKNSVASILAGLFSIVRAGILLVLLIAVGLTVTGQNVAVWIDSNGMPSIEGPGPNVRMAIPITGTLEGAGRSDIQDLYGILRLAPGAGHLRLVNSIIVIALLLITVWVLGEFKALFRTLEHGQPFTAANAARLQKIAWLVILGEIARSAIVYFETSWAATNVTIEGFHLETHFQVNAFAILWGLMILAIATAWREGVRLQEEQSLTV